jgi:nitrate reductase gamma subunit
MAEILVIFSGLPFLFLVSVAVAPPPLIEKLELYQKLPLLSQLAFASYCLFPVYLFVDLLVKIIPHSLMFTVNDVFQLLLLIASAVLGWYLHQLVEDVRKQAETRAIRVSLEELLKRASMIISNPVLPTVRQAPPTGKRGRKSKR